MVHVSEYEEDVARNGLNADDLEPMGATAI